jgi:hypothetical protein
MDYDQLGIPECRTSYAPIGGLVQCGLPSREKYGHQTLEINKKGTDLVGFNSTRPAP